MSLPMAFVIEDDEVIAKIFATAIQVARFDVVVIRDGNQAMERLKQAEPALVILDLHLPGISGINILREIRKDERLVNTHVVIVSADSTQSEFMRMNADQVMVKPIGFHTLIETASRYRPD